MQHPLCSLYVQIALRSQKIVGAIENDGQVED